MLFFLKKRGQLSTPYKKKNKYWPSVQASLKPTRLGFVVVDQ